MDHFFQVLLDDILLYSKNKKEHKEHLQLVLNCLSEHKLFGKLLKCSFFQKEIHYLGHIISREGILVVESLLYMNSIRCEKEVENFAAELLQK